MDIIEIEISFENLDYIRIPIRFFNIVEINYNSEVKKTIDYMGRKFFSVIKGAADIYLEINKDIDKMNYKSWGDIFEAFNLRILENDISSLRLYYSKRNYEDIYVLWDDQDEYRNRNQRVSEDKNSYQISISKRNSLRERMV